MSAEYVRNYYGVDYKVGDRLVLQAGTPHEQHGTLVSFPGAHLGIRFDGDNFTKCAHPTWEISREIGDNT